MGWKEKRSPGGLRGLAVAGMKEVGKRKLNRQVHGMAVAMWSCQVQGSSRDLFHGDEGKSTRCSTMTCTNSSRVGGVYAYAHPT
jgi:hypothetical protein